MHLDLRIKVGIVCIGYALSGQPDLFAQTDTADASIQEYEFRDVEITGRRSQTVTSTISRVISVISKEDLERQGLASFIDILEYLSNADIRQRGNMGVQSDISLRGGSFDHVMILLNGINMSDPQTGHLALDLPIDPETIERIEVLEGPAARALGSGAFSGAINIITKKGTKPEIKTVQMFGEHGLLRTNINAGLKTGEFFHFLSAGRSSSDGYIANSDHKLYNIYYRASTLLKQIQFDLQAGYQDKKFGAGGFYSPRFPMQYEENSGWFGSLKVASGNRVRYNNQIYWRRRNDHFVLVRDNPVIIRNQNYHQTDVYGSQLSVTLTAGNFAWNGGIDLRSENILSNNIGFAMPEPLKVRNTDSAYYTKEYHRTGFSVFAEQVFTPGNWDITAGVMINRSTGFPGKVSVFPGIEAGYTTENGLTAFVSFNRALHLPTFTDLFYTDLLNQGNLNLDPNRILSFEGGIKHQGSVLNYQLSGFYNSGKDIVDWLWNYEIQRFRPANLDSYTSIGFSSAVTADLSKLQRANHWPQHITFNYSWLAEDKSSTGRISKYYSLRHKLSATVSLNVLKSLRLTSRISYQDRYGNAIQFDEARGENGEYYEIPYKPYWLADGILTWKLRFVEFYSEVSNILNTRYIDTGSVYQPGRWVKAGISVTLDYK